MRVREVVVVLGAAQKARLMDVVAQPAACASAPHSSWLPHCLRALRACAMQGC